MHTITSLRKALALTTTNQVRNRIESIRDVLEPHLRRGPNNQILLADEGLALLRRLQELYDSGLRLTEASDVIRASSLSTGCCPPTVSPGFVQYEAKPAGGLRDIRQPLDDELAALRTRVADLEARLARSAATQDAAPAPWWAALREDADVS